MVLADEVSIATYALALRHRVDGFRLGNAVLAPWPKSTGPTLITILQKASKEVKASSLEAPGSFKETTRVVFSDVR